MKSRVLTNLEHMTRKAWTDKKQIQKDFWNEAKVTGKHWHFFDAKRKIVSFVEDSIRSYFPKCCSIGAEINFFLWGRKKFNRFFKRKNCQEKIFDCLPKCALADWRWMIDEKNFVEESEDRRQRSLSYCGEFLREQIKNFNSWQIDIEISERIFLNLIRNETILFQLFICQWTMVLFIFI